MILHVYCIELVTRISKHIHFPFYDFSTIYYEFPSIQPITEINKTPKKEKRSLGPKRPSSTRSSGQGSPAQPKAADPVQHGAEESHMGSCVSAPLGLTLSLASGSSSTSFSLITPLRGIRRIGFSAVLPSGLVWTLMRLLVPW